MGVIVHGVLVMEAPVNLIPLRRKITEVEAELIAERPPPQKNRVRSMTGYGQSEGRHGDHSWRWEIRSKNKADLGIVVSVPKKMQRVERACRRKIQERLSRGDVWAGLTLTNRAEQGCLKIDEERLQEVLAAAERIAALVGGGKPSVDTILGAPGVLRMVGQEEGIPEAEREALIEAITADFEVALFDLEKWRRREGKALGHLVDSYLFELQLLACRCARDGEAQAEAKARTYVLKDVEEEVQRIMAHVEEARGQLRGAGASGRALEFIGQELVRELVTLKNKAKRSGIGMRAKEMDIYLQRIREQVRNIE